MPLAQFLRDLFDHGRLKVEPPRGQLSAEDRAAAQAVLVEHEALRRGEFPGQPPPLDLPSVLWAAEMLWRACQLAVFRDLDAAAIEELLATPCPPADPASRHWSVDLVFRFLPDLVRHASRAAAEDPLVRRLREWAVHWPLSSIGMAEIKPDHLAEIAASPGLVRLYVDRILAKKDFARLDDPAIRDAARQALGAHGNLWPELARRLAPTTTNNAT